MNSDFYSNIFLFYHGKTQVQEYEADEGALWKIGFLIKKSEF